MVVMVVNLMDFDSLFSRHAVKMMPDPIESRKSEEIHFIFVVNKVDLLHPRIPPAHLDKWVFIKAHVGGIPKLNHVFLVNSHKDLGLENLIAWMKELVDPRGNVWVIGAQKKGRFVEIG